MKKKKVLIATGHEFQKKQLTESERSIEGNDQAAICDRIIEDLLSLEPDIVIIDMESSDYDLSPAISSIRDRYPLARIIIMSRPENGNGTLSHVIRNENKSCMVMDTSIETIITTIENEYSSEIILSPAMSQKLSKDLLKPKIPEHLRKAAQEYNLDPREIEILQLLLRGATNNEISRALSITEITVKAHLNKIYDKLNVVNRYQATSVVIKKSIVADRK